MNEPDSPPGPAPEVPSVFVARNEAQARDWALVLVSRGVESTLGQDPVSGRWFLLVPANQRDRGAAELRAYHQENRRWSWRATVSDTELPFHWSALAWVLAIGFAFQFGRSFAEHGWFDAQRFARGEWWRAITSVWLHSDIAHLASNAIYGSLVLGLALGRYGAGIGLLGGLVGGIAGNLLGFWVRPGRDYIGLGSSGMVMAGLGMLGAYSIRWWRHGRAATRFVLPGLFAGGFLFLQLGTSPGSDVVAHLGGFATGVLYGAVATCLPDRLRIAINRPAGVLFLLVSGIGWGFALAH